MHGEINFGSRHRRQSVVHIIIIIIIITHYHNNLRLIKVIERLIAAAPSQRAFH